MKLLFVKRLKRSQNKKFQLLLNIEKKDYKTHFDELARDHRFNNLKELFKVNICFTTIDMVTFQIKNRFLGLRKVLDLFLFLTSKIILTLIDTELRNKTILLQQ